MQKMNKEEAIKIIQSINDRYAEMKVIVFKYNIRYKDKPKGVLELRKSEVFYGNEIAEEILKDYRLLPDTMLMDYDLEGICEQTGRGITYDRGIIKTYKPLEYWKENLK
jgi:hypothetical protein